MFAGVILAFGANVLCQDVTDTYILYSGGLCMPIAFRRIESRRGSHFSSVTSGIVLAVRRC